MVVKISILKIQNGKCMTDLHKSWHNHAEWVSSKIQSLKIQDGGWPMCLRDPFCIIMKYLDFLI